MKKIFIILGLLFAICYLPYASFAAMDSANYQIWADTFSVGGGENQTSTNYNLQDTLDQGISGGSASSTNNSLRVGYRFIDYFRGQEVLTLALDASELNFGTLSKTATKSVFHGLIVDTNSSHGLLVTYAGETLTCTNCSGTIAAIGATPAGAAPGVSQFGLNVLYSTSSPALPHATASATYGTGSVFAFSSGDQIVSSTGPINQTTFIVNYIANMSGAETPGLYSTTITYTATANF